SAVPLSSFTFFCFFLSVLSPPAIYTLSLHDALPIYCGTHTGTAQRVPVGKHRLHLPACRRSRSGRRDTDDCGRLPQRCRCDIRTDRKSTRLNSSHVSISYAVFCLKKKNLYLSIRVPI